MTEGTAAQKPMNDNNEKSRSSVQSRLDRLSRRLIQLSTDKTGMSFSVIVLNRGLINLVSLDSLHPRHKSSPSERNWLVQCPVCVSVCMCVPVCVSVLIT